jgi:hypothetical protein
MKIIKIFIPESDMAQAQDTNITKKQKILEGLYCVPKNIVKNINVNFSTSMVVLMIKILYILY